MQTTLGITVFILTVYTYSLYIYKMVTGGVTPHIFTFLPSAIVVSIITVAQFQNDGGWTVWMSGMTALSCIIIVILAPWYGETHITRFDTLSLIACIVTIIIWIFTKNDLLAVMLSCLINGLAFLPTWRKIYHKPDTESSTIYFLSAFRAGLSVLSISNLIMVNWFFPAYLVVNNIGLGVFRMLRAKHHQHNKNLITLNK